MLKPYVMGCDTWIAKYSSASTHKQGHTKLGWNCSNDPLAVYLILLNGWLITCYYSSLEYSA